MSTRKTIHAYIHVAMLSAAIICAGFAIGRAAGSDTEPRVIGYEGFLSQDAGPVTGTVQAVFHLFDAQQDGTGNELWTSGAVQVQVVDGWFSVALGDNTPRELDGVTFQQNSFPDGVWSASRLFLEVVINGVPLGGRQEILANPYAVRGVPGADFRATQVTVDHNLSAGGDLSVSGNVYTGQCRWTTKTRSDSSVGGDLREDYWECPDGTFVAGVHQIEQWSDYSHTYVAKIKCCPL